MATHCPHCSTPIDEAARECPRCGGAVSRRSFSSLPVTGRLEGSERREASVLFCDLGGYTQWNEEEDPEDVAAAMEAIRLEAVRVFASYGGIVNQFVGDEVMGLFGVVSSHEDDPCRAIAAALALHAFLRSSSAPPARRGTRTLRLHSGAETGLIYARVHDLRSGLFEITGDAVNIAARLRSHAGVDELLCGPELQQRIQPFFQLEPLAPVILPGKSQAIVPQRVAAAAHTVSPFEVAAVRGLTSYVDRERELQTLLEVWQQAERGSGALISVVGLPGVGKTRFLHEFRARVSPGVLVVHGRCSAFRNVAPYQPFSDALIGLGDGRALDAGPRVAELAARYALSAPAVRALEALLGSPLTAAGEPAGDALRSAIVAALCELLAAAAVERPVLVIFEDWQWADESSRAALRQIGQQIEAQRMLIAINYRSTELTEQAQPRASLQIELAPLSSHNTEHMARGLLGGGQLPPGLSDFVHSRTLGNPFFVEEICRALLERGTCKVQSDSIVLLKPLFQFRAPSTVQAMVRARVDRLPDPQRDLLRWAAVIGPHFSLELLEALANDQIPQPGAAEPDAPTRVRLLGILEELEAHGLIRRGSALPPTYDFGHAITQEVVYESLPVQLRRRHHGRLAREIQLRTPPDRLEGVSEALAHHYRRSFEPDKAIEYAVMAGDKAWRSLSVEQAGLQYQLAIQELGRSAASSDGAASRHIDVSLSWARVGIYNPHADQLAALRDSLAFAERLGDARRACLCLDWLSWIEYGLGNQEPALAHAERFLERAEAFGEARLTAQALLNIGRCQVVATEYGLATEAIERGLSMRGRGAGAARLYGLGMLVLIHGDRGEFARAQTLVDQATAAIAPQQISLLGPLLIQRGMVAAWQGAWDACAATGEQAHDIAQRIEGKYILGMSLVLTGYARFMRDHDRAGLGALREGIDLLEAHAIRLHLGFVWGVLASALAQCGEYDEAQLAAERALARASARDRIGELDALRALALVAGLRDKNLARAELQIEQALQLAAAKASAREVALCEHCLGQILRFHGLTAGASAAQTSAREHADSLGLRLPRDFQPHADRVEQGA